MAVFVGIRSVSKVIVYHTKKWQEKDSDERDPEHGRFNIEVELMHARQVEMVLPCGQNSMDLHSALNSRIRKDIPGRYQASIVPTHTSDADKP